MTCFVGVFTLVFIHSYTRCLEDISPQINRACYKSKSCNCMLSIFSLHGRHKKGAGKREIRCLGLVKGEGTPFASWKPGVPLPFAFLVCDTQVILSSKVGLRDWEKAVSVFLLTVLPRSFEPACFFSIMNLYLF